MTKSEMFHDYEVVMLLDDGRFRTCKWSKNNEEGYETPDDQYEAVLDLVRGCRFSDTNYYVFKDEKLISL